MTDEAALREFNRRRVLEALRHGPLSRTQLGAHTGLSRTTIGTLVAELIRSGQVTEARPAALRTGRRGRPPVLLGLAKPCGWLIGADFEHGSVRVAMADASGTVGVETSMQLDVDRDAGAALDRTADLLRDLLVGRVTADRPVLAAAACIPAPVDARTGVVGAGNILPGWTGLRPQLEIGLRTGLAVAIDNDANLAALGEASFGAGRGIDDALYIKVSTGLGAALLLAGELYRGSTGLAGEIGHIQVRPDGDICRCGARGCLETVVSVPRVIATVRAAYPAATDATSVDRLVRVGDPAVRRVVTDAGRAIGRVVAGVAGVLDPAAIIVGGDFVDAVAPLIEGVREAVVRYSQPGSSAALRVVPGELGQRAELLGAIALAARLASDAAAGYGGAGHPPPAGDGPAQRPPAAGSHE